MQGDLWELQTETVLMRCQVYRSVLVKLRSSFYVSLLMPGSDSGKKSINTRDETRPVTLHTQGHGAVQPGPGAGCSQCTVGIQPVTSE